MKVILSRKGCDTGNGGIPSPILPDDRFHPLPIPYNKGAPIRYRDLPPPSGLEGHGATLADVMRALGSKVQPDTIAHLDPDLMAGSLSRPPGWRPLFGQTGQPLSILREVQEGDLFVLFGLYDRLLVDGSLRYAGERVHTVYGWLQVGKRHDAPFPALPPWARYHPHAHDTPGAPWDPRANTIFEAAERLSIPGLAVDLPGAGVLSRYHEGLRLTRPDGARVDSWRLPPAFAPLMGTDRWPCMGRRKWQRAEDGSVLVETQGVWQEAPFDLDDAPDVLGWLAGIFGGAAAALPERPPARPTITVTLPKVKPPAPRPEPAARPARGDHAGRVLAISPEHGGSQVRLRAWQAMQRGGYVAIGFAHVDLSAVPDRAALRRLLDTEVAPNRKCYALLPDTFNAAGAAPMIGTFLFDVGLGDLVIVTHGEAGILGCGRITSDYRYEPHAHPTTGSRWEAYSHLRSVEWLSTAFIPASHFPAGMPRWAHLRTLSLPGADEPWVQHYLQAAGLDGTRLQPA